MFCIIVTLIVEMLGAGHFDNSLAHILSVFLFQFLTKGKERGRKTKKGRSERLVGSDEHRMVAKQLIEITGKR